MTLPGGIGDVATRAWGITGTPTDGDTTSKDIAGWNQPTVEAALKSGVKASAGWQASSAAVWEGLVPGLPLPLAILTALAQQVLKLPETIWNSIEDVSTAVGTFIQDLWKGFSQLVDILAGAIVTPINAAIQLVKDWFAGNEQFRESTETTQINLQNFQISTIAAGRANPDWVCEHEIADVTYPDIHNIILATFPTDDQSSSNGTAQAAMYPVAQGQARGGIIKIATTTVHDTIGMRLRKASGSLNNVYIDVLRRTPADGWVRVAQSDDISPLITTTVTDVEVAIPGGLIVQSRERYMVRVRNQSSTSTAVQAQCIGQSPRSVDKGALFTTNAADDSYTAAEIDAALAASEYLPFAYLAAQNLAETDRSWSDDFNRSALGGTWSCASNTGSNQLNIVNNQLSFIGGTDGHQNGINITRMAGDANLISGDIILNPLGHDREVGLALHCSRDFSQMVVLALRASGGARFYSGSMDSLTERAVDSSGGGGRWAAYYDIAADKYVALKDDSPTGLEWTGVGSAVEHGEDFRWGGGRVVRWDFLNAGQIDNITLRDWQPAA